MKPLKTPVGPRSRPWLWLGAGVLAALAAALGPQGGGTAFAAAPPAPAASATAPRSDPPPASELSYEVFGQAKGFDYRATGSLSWRREGPNYEARLELAMPQLLPEGAIVRAVAIGLIDEDGMMASLHLLQPKRAASAA